MTNIVEVKKSTEKGMYEVMAADGIILAYVYREYQPAFGNPRYVGHFRGGYEWTLDMQGDHSVPGTCGLTFKTFPTLAQVKSFVAEKF